MTVCVGISNKVPTGPELSSATTPVTYEYTEYREAFALFDKKGTGAVPRDVLGDLLRALGQNPTQAEVADIVSASPAEGTTMILSSYASQAHRSSTILSILST